MENNNLLEDITKSIRENSDYVTGNLYDFIAQNYLRMSKSDLKDVLLEVIYSLEDSSLCADRTKECLIANISDRIG